MAPILPGHSHGENLACEEIGQDFRDAWERIVSKLFEEERISDFSDMCIHIAFEMIEKGVDTYLFKNEALEQELSEQDEVIDGLATSMDELLALCPEVAESLPMTSWNKRDVLRESSLLAKAVKTIIRAKETEEKRRKTLEEKNASKDRKLEAKEKDLLWMRDERSVREENLAKTIQKLELELGTARIKAEESRKEVENVKTKWSKKLQRGYDKVAALEKEHSELLAKNETFKLDNDAFALELKKLEVKVIESENMRAAARETSNLKKENEGLKVSLRSLRTTQQMENDRIQSAIRAAVSSKEAEIKKLTRDRQSDEATIQELSRAKQDLKKQNEEKAETIAIWEAYIGALCLNLQHARKDLREERAKAQVSSNEAYEQLRIDWEGERSEKQKLLEKLRVIQSAMADV
ncbi:hypothetical protein BP6252_12177 [Coleophoma cylindrospora]|uniref:Uncharacterized protein n=1 Tax=Coleophoma cylindrospora TaxID=1849047 RepID=A0A3D8QH95_9HELO|nr:hypothetical protein BP6252_12177 [Coleophoma cylindrospora]